MQTVSPLFYGDICIYVTTICSQLEIDNDTFESIIFGIDFEIGLWMEADWADIWSFGTDDDVTAVAALPDVNATLTEHFCCLDIM